MKTGNASTLFKRLPSPENIFFWLCFLIIIKFSLLYFLVNQNHPTTISQSIGICSGDCDSYLLPIDNLVTNGVYEPDYRMPGYGIFYLLFRLFFEKNCATTLLILFQTLIDCIASLVLARFIYRITNNKTGFYLTLLFYGIGVSVSCYNNFVLTESITSSVLIFALYFLERTLNANRKYDALLTGLFFTLAYFLRSVNLLLVIIPLLLLLFSKKENRFKLIFIFLLPVFVFQSMWTVRNYERKNKFYILNEKQYMAFYRPSLIAMCDFCKTFSDFKTTSPYFEPQGLTYFGQPVQLLQLKDLKIPEWIYTKDFSEDSLLMIRTYFLRSDSSAPNSENRMYFDSLIASKCNLYSASLKKYHPVRVYIFTPLMLLRNFILQSGVHNLYFKPFSLLTIKNKLIKLLFIGLYWIVFLTFLIPAFLFPRKIIDNKILLVVYLISFYIIFIHPIILRLVEQRYIIPAYPFFVTGSVYFLVMLTEKIKNKISRND